MISYGTECEYSRGQLVQNTRDKKRPPGFYTGRSKKFAICKVLAVKTLLQGLPGSNSQVNGHTDHGVVTSAQEAHHLNVKPPLGGFTLLFQYDKINII